MPPRTGTSVAPSEDSSSLELLSFSNLVCFERQKKNQSIRNLSVFDEDLTDESSAVTCSVYGAPATCQTLANAEGSMVSFSAGDVVYSFPTAAVTKYLKLDALNNRI